jgi:histone-lysine N-methyltransferase SETMAR
MPSKSLRGRRKTGLILHHDNAPGHTASLTSECLAKNKIKTIRHPPYSPDLAMYDFWLFAGLKRHLRGRSFESEEEIDAPVLEYLNSIPESVWHGAFDAWKSRMERCIEAEGYFE